MADTRILIVEDEGIVAKDIQGTLENWGYRIPSVAFSGEEAIAKTEETIPDLILMDVKLAGDIDGVEAARQIRSRFDIPVVYLTVYTDKNTLDRVRMTEPSGYVLKPFNETELCMTIQTAVYKHRIERELRAAVKKIREDLESARRLCDIGVFASTVACKLQDSLGVMETALLNMKQKNRNFFLDGHLVDMEQKISESGQIVKNLLNYSQITEPRCQPVSVTDILDECLANDKEKYPQWNVTVRKKYHCARNDCIDADPLHLIQIFGGILDNIFQAFADKDGDIMLELDYNRDENVCRIIFGDNGSGIDPEDLPKVFEPFFTRKPHSAGLGLSLCRRLVDLYGGKIDVTSQKGVGTTFCIHFPIARTLPPDGTGPSI